MRLSRLAFEVRAGMAHRPVRMLAAACAALALAACGGGEYPYSTGARMADDTLLTYRVKAALDQDTALNARQVRIASTADGRVVLTGWVDTPRWCAAPARTSGTSSTAPSWTIACACCRMRPASAAGR